MSEDENRSTDEKTDENTEKIVEETVEETKEKAIKQKKVQEKRIKEKRIREKKTGTTKNPNTPKNIPVLLKLLLPMILLVSAEVAIFAGMIFGGDLISYMEQNEKAILKERVINRKSYLERKMLLRWSDVSDTVSSINGITSDLLLMGKISWNTLDDGSAEALPLLRRSAPLLIDLMRNNEVTGAFLILNTDDLRESENQGIYKDKPGIYIRDYDPDARPSDRNEDLILKYAPAEIVKTLNISLGKLWEPQFSFGENGKYDAYFYEPYQTALETQNPQKMAVSDLGYWSLSHRLDREEKDVISYSVPLVLPTGRVYGVLGIDLTIDYLKTLIPSRELLNGNAGLYLLGAENEDDGVFYRAMVNGPLYNQVLKENDNWTIVWDGDDALIENEQGKKIYCDVEYLNLYNRNTAFSNQRWALIGAAETKDLFVFSDRVIQVLIRAVLLMMGVGIAGGALISSMISHPISHLTRNVQSARPSVGIQFDRTGIREIDLLAEKLEDLNQEMFYEAERIAHIINMTSVPIALFETNREENSVFLTDKFFEMFEIDREISEDLTIQEFERIIKDLEPYRRNSRQYIDEKKRQERIYKIPVLQRKGSETARESKAETSAEKSTERNRVEAAQKENPTSVRYVRMTLSDDGNRCIGLVEDVTDTTLERKSIEFERDHDLLTGILNRRAFLRKMQQLFDQGETVLKTAALLMIDMDELKFVNDTYGHEFGDRYLKTAAHCFQSSVLEKSIVSRQSGDEFQIFLYGYETEEEVREKIEILKEKIREASLDLPDGRKLSLQLSGGVAWYPKDSTEYEQLKIYSDSAMYEVKHSTKGAIRDYKKA